MSAPRYHGLFAWKESDASEYDVRDLIGILELLNVFDYHNGSGKHPMWAYEKWSTPLEKFADDFEQNRTNLKNSKYYRLRKLLLDGLTLYDYIRRQFSLSRLPVSTRARFSGVLRVWEEAASELVAETFNATSEIGRMPDQLGKNRKHWDNLHITLQLRFLRAQLEAQQAERRTNRRPAAYSRREHPRKSGGVRSACGARTSDRDRGADRSAAPPTPPYVRVRIRRFDWFCYRPSNKEGSPNEVR